MSDELVIDARTPYYLVESSGSKKFWCGPSWVDFTDDPRKAVRFLDRQAAEDFRYEWLTSSKVSEHADISAEQPRQGLSRRQCNSIQYLVDQMRGASSADYIDMLDALRGYINSLVRDAAPIASALPAKDKESK
jgi:hypothetical protein